ncbi:MAG: substrate-binding domain-containing protein [Solirubrobacteraceae bacterium]
MRGAGRVAAILRLSVAAAAGAAAIAGCGSATAGAGSTAATSNGGGATASEGGATASNGGGAAARGGSVSLLYAGSLEDFVERQLSPAFRRASGYALQGFGGGSNELASAVKGGVRLGDVFISAAPSADGELEGAANGRWVGWYATFAHSPLVLGYNSHTSYGRQLARGVPWWKVIAQRGIVVGRTEPKLDPKGQLTVGAVDAAARRLHDPELQRALPSFPVYPETDLVARLQAGQVDAGFFYAVEAQAAGFPTVPLTPVSMSAQYTLTILRGARRQAGAEALVRFLLGHRQRAMLARGGLVTTTPALHGDVTSVPSGIRRVLRP